MKSAKTADGRSLLGFLQRCSVIVIMLVLLPVLMLGAQDKAAIVDRIFREGPAGHELSSWDGASPQSNTLYFLSGRRVVATRG